MKVEKQNDVNINVFAYTDGSDQTRNGKPNKLYAGFYAVKLSEAAYSSTMNVLLISTEFIQHFVLIQSLSGLLSENSRNTRAKHYWVRCLRGYVGFKI